MFTVQVISISTGRLQEREFDKANAMCDYVNGIKKYYEQFENPMCFRLLDNNKALILEIKIDPKL